MGQKEEKIRELNKNENGQFSGGKSDLQIFIGNWLPLGNEYGPKKQHLLAIFFY